MCLVSGYFVQFSSNLQIETNLINWLLDFLYQTMEPQGKFNVSQIRLLNTNTISDSGECSSVSELCQWV